MTSASPDARCACVCAVIGLGLLYDLNRLQICTSLCVDWSMGGETDLASPGSQTFTSSVRWFVGVGGMFSFLLYRVRCCLG